MMVTYVDHQTNIYGLICTDFCELSVHIPIFEHNSYTEKNSRMQVQIFRSEKLKNNEIFMEWYNVTD